MLIGEPMLFNVTTLMSRFSFCSPIPSMISERSHTRIIPMLVPVTAVSEPGINTVFVNVDWAFLVS